MRISISQSAQGGFQFCGGMVMVHQNRRRTAPSGRTPARRGHKTELQAKVSPMKRLTFIVGLVALCALAFVPDIVEGALVEPSKCFEISLEDKTTNDNWLRHSGTDTDYVGLLMFCRFPPVLHSRTHSCGAVLRCYDA
jgi:hypothetical protein